MKITSITLHSLYNRNIDTPKKCRANFQQLKTDTVFFSSSELSADKKMDICAVKLLKNLKENQPVYIKGDAKYLPFMETLSKEAYKKGSGLVHLEVIEPEIEVLKKKYGINEDFDYKKIRKNYYKNAMVFEFNQTNNPYKLAKLSENEIKSELEKLSPTIPSKLQNKFKASPKEILKDALDIHEGQPVFIKGEREHLPLIVKLVDFLYSKNKTKLVDIEIYNNNLKNMYLYANENVLDIFPEEKTAKTKEYYEKDVAWCQLEGSDPNKFDGVDVKKIQRNQKAYSDEYHEWFDKTTAQVPWVVYYAPTTKSCIYAYNEFDNKFDALNKAYEDANQINRIGKLEKHTKALNHRAEILNQLVKDGYRTLHYVSVNDKTKLPDGKTDFKITLSPKSIFVPTQTIMPKYNHKPICNIPSEEVFTAPLASSAQGTVYTTIPMDVDGKIVDGIRLTFDKGKVVDIYADKNEDVLKAFIRENKNADRLGEVAIVADSPIAKTGRVFNSILIDENATCHLALGNSYIDSVDGAMEIEGYKAQQEYLDKLDINSSSVHKDFMIGGKNVYISAINEETGDSIDLIKNDKFLL